MGYVTAEMLSGDAEGLSASTNLLALGVIDSLSVVMLRLFVKNEFGVNLDKREVSDFSSVAALSELVERMQREGTG